MLSKWNNYARAKGKSCKNKQFMLQNGVLAGQLSGRRTVLCGVRWLCGCQQARVCPAY